MQWNIDWLLAWLISTSISITDLEGAMWKQMLCPKLTGVKMTKLFWPIQAIVTATLTRQGNDYIESIPCSPQAIESFAPSIHDNVQVVCKSLTLSEIESDSDSYHCSDPLWTQNCMTTLDWAKVQAEVQVIHDLIQWYGTK